MRRCAHILGTTAWMAVGLVAPAQDTITYATQEKSFQTNLNPGEFEKVIPFWIDKCWSVGQYAKYLTKLKYKIEDPDGIIQDKTNSWDTTKDGNGFGKKDPKPGLWKLHLEPLSPLTEPIKVGFFQMFTGPALNALVVTPGAPTRLGDRVPIMVTTADKGHDNNPVLGITVTNAQIVIPGPFGSVTRQPLVLTDDGTEPGGVAGDGVWGCWFVAEKEGWYSVSVSVEGPTPDGGRFQRDCLGNFQVKRQKARLTGKVDVEVKKVFPEERK